MGDFVRDHSKSFFGNMCDFIDLQPDYNPDKQRPQVGMYIKGGGEDTWLRRLEDIDVSWISKYLQNIMYSARVNDRDSISAMNKEYKETRVFADDEGDLTSEADLQVITHKNSVMDYLQWRNELPRLILRLNFYSTKVGIHLISLIVAFEKEYKRARASGENVRPTAVLSHGVYVMNADGSIGRRITENRGKFATWAFKWIKCEYGFVDSYTETFKELLSICKKMEIDVCKENPLLYTKEFMNLLKRKYMLVRSPEYKEEILSMINNANYPIGEKELSPADLYSTPMTKLYRTAAAKAQLFLNSDNEEILMYKDSDLCLNELCPILGLLNGVTRDIKGADSSFEFENKRLVPSKIVTKNGFLLYKGNYLITDIKMFTQNRYLIQPAIVHCSGFFVALTPDEKLFYLNLNLAKQYLRIAMTNSIDTLDKFTFGNNQPYGTWERA